LATPVTKEYEDDNVLFICPPCHLEEEGHRGKIPYYVCLKLIATVTVFDLTTLQGFYHSPHPKCKKDEMSIKNLTAVYASPAKIHGSAQLVPRSRLQGDGVAILNFRLSSFGDDTGDLGRILGPFAAAFFPVESRKSSLVIEHIEFDLAGGKVEHKEKMMKITERLSTAGWVSQIIAGSHFIDTVLVRLSRL
jgi:hypothetical protein